MCELVRHLNIHNRKLILIKSNISKRGTNICKWVKKTKMYKQYKPQKLSVCVTEFCGTRLQIATNAEKKLKVATEVK